MFIMYREDKKLKVDVLKGYVKSQNVIIGDKININLFFILYIISPAMGCDFALTLRFVISKHN